MNGSTLPAAALVALATACSGPSELGEPPSSARWGEVEDCGPCGCSGIRTSLGRAERDFQALGDGDIVALRRPRGGWVIDFVTRVEHSRGPEVLVETTVTAADGTIVADAGWNTAPTTLFDYDEEACVGWAYHSAVLPPLTPDDACALHQEYADFHVQVSEWEFPDHAASTDIRLVVELERTQAELYACEAGW